MFKRKKIFHFFFEGVMLNKLEEYTYCALMPEEEEAWKKLKQYLKNNSLLVWCTLNGWDNFLNNTLLTGNVDNFINYLENLNKSFPSKMYHLTDNGMLRIAKVTQKKDI